MDFVPLRNARNVEASVDLAPRIPSGGEAPKAAMHGHEEGNVRRITAFGAAGCRLLQGARARSEVTVCAQLTERTAATPVARVGVAGDERVDRVVARVSRAVGGPWRLGRPSPIVWARKQLPDETVHAASSNQITSWEFKGEPREIHGTGVAMN